MSEKSNFSLNLIIPIVIILVFIISAVGIILLPQVNESNFGPAESFEAITTKGENYSLGQDLGHKMIIIDFMATWCTPCKSIGDVYADVLKDYSDKLSVVSITTYYRDESSILANWSQGWKFNWIFIPYSNKTEKIIELFGGIDEGIPFSYFIDLDGIIRVKHLGAKITYSNVENWIKGIY
ncbi:MAG: TlpA family protein disulfide reductase [Candidatus Hodarchaeales archaeon]